MGYISHTGGEMSGENGNLSGNITISRREKFLLEQKAKQGWRCFFILRDNFDILCQSYNTLIEDNREMVKLIREGGEIDINHLKNQFVEMYDKLKEYTECPVCFETLTKENLDVPTCGHVICKGCKERIMADKCLCPICKKKYSRF